MSAIDTAPCPEIFDGSRFRRTSDTRRSGTTNDSDGWRPADAMVWTRSGRRMHPATTVLEIAASRPAVSEDNNENSQVHRDKSTFLEEKSVFNCDRHALPRGAIRCGAWRGGSDQGSTRTLKPTAPCWPGRSSPLNRHWISRLSPSSSASPLSPLATTRHANAEGICLHTTLSDIRVV